MMSSSSLEEMLSYRARLKSPESRARTEFVLKIKNYPLVRAITNHRVQSMGAPAVP